MEDNFIDLTVTSPPYDNLRTYNNNIDETWGEDVWKPIIKELYRVTKEGGVVVWVVGDATINGSESGVSFQQALYAKEVGFNLHDTMIYHKDSCPFPETTRYYPSFEYMFVFTKGKIATVNLLSDKKNRQYGDRVASSTQRGKDGKTSSVSAKKTNPNKTVKEFGVRQNVWKYSPGKGKSTNDNLAYNHPAIYPESLAKDHIKSWSNEGDLVYDPFMGSGTTAKMAHLLKRNWIGSELSQEYVDLAYKRLEPYLRQTTLF